MRRAAPLRFFLGSDGGRWGWLWLLGLVLPTLVVAQPTDDLEVLLSRGQAYLDGGNFDAAEEAFDAALAQDSMNLTAHYGLGMIERERAGYKSVIHILRQRRQWRRAVEHFEAVLAQDSAFRDVLWQRALVEVYRLDYEAALPLAQAQRRLRPTLVHVQIGTWRLHWLYWYHENRKARTWMAARPQETLARLTILDGLRRQLYEDREPMEPRLIERLRELLGNEDGVSDVAVRMALALAYAQDAKPVLAEAQFWRGVDAIANPIDAAFAFELVKYIMRDEELRQYRRLTTPAAYQEFFRAFWRKRDPMPAAEGNERLRDHFARLLYAEREFTYTSHYNWYQNFGPFAWLSFPEVYALNQEFNDLGLIYLRQGDPDDRVFTLGENVPSNLSWRYLAADGSPQMTFHFMNPAGGNWRLVPALMHPEMAGDRAGWGNLYAQLWRAYRNNEQADLIVAQQEMEAASQAAVEVALRTERHTWPDDIDPLGMHVQFIPTRAASGLTRVDVYYGVPMAPLYAAERQKRLILETGLAVHDEAWQPVFQDLSRKAITPNDDPSAGVVDLFTFTAAPDSYHVALHVQPANTDLLGAVRFDTRLPNFDADGLQLSGLLLATRIEPAENEGLFVRGDLLVVPNPTRRFSVNQSVFLYFELYNLGVGPDLLTDYEIEYTLTPEKPRRRFFRRDRGPAWTLRTPQGGAETRTIEYLEIDAGEVDAGSYLLTVAVTDRRTGRTATRTERIVLF